MSEVESVSYDHPGDSSPVAYTLVLHPPIYNSKAIGSNTLFWSLWTLTHDLYSYNMITFRHHHNKNQTHVDIPIQMGWVRNIFGKLTFNIIMNLGI